MLQELILTILAHYQEIIAQGLIVIGAFVALLTALYGLFLLIPGEHPDKEIKAVLDFTKRFSRK